MNGANIMTHSPAVQKVLDAMAQGEDGIDCEGLSDNQRLELANALGWGMTPRVQQWIWSGPKQAPEPTDEFDYEGAILARQEREMGDF